MRASGKEEIAIVQSWKNIIWNKSFSGLNSEVMEFWVDTAQFKVSSLDQIDYMSIIVKCMSSITPRYLADWEKRTVKFSTMRESGIGIEFEILGADMDGQSNQQNRRCQRCGVFCLTQRTCQAAKKEDNVLTSCCTKVFIVFFRQTSWHNPMILSIRHQ